MGKNLFYKVKDPKATKKFKVKSFLSETKTVEDFRQISTFDWLLVIDLTARSCCRRRYKVYTKKVLWSDDVTSRGRSYRV